MSPLDVNSSLVYTDNVIAGTASAAASWAGHANHVASAGSATFGITPASSAVTLTCPASLVYTGAAITPCTAEATGAGMSPLDVSSSLVYTDNFIVGTAAAADPWVCDANQVEIGVSESFGITPAS